MICPKCNKETAEGLDFCTSCGNSLKDTEVSTDKNKITLKKSLIIALTVVAVIGALYFSGVIAPSSGSAEDAAIASVEAYLEFDYEQTLSLFPDKTLDAIDEMEPSIITRYAIDICNAFNRFYQECPIATCEDSDRRAFRLALTKGVHEILGRALELVCIKHPDKI